MPTFELMAYTTEEHGETAIRYREFTGNERRARLFSKIPRIQFTDSGHGIVFVSHQRDAGLRMSRKKVVNTLKEHVLKALQEIDAADKAATPKPKSKSWKKEAMDLQLQVANLERENKQLKQDKESIRRSLAAAVEKNNV